jgi:hypothetical protein
MNKLLKILIAILAVILIAFAGWYFLLRDPDIPAGEAIRNLLPFGSPGDTVEPGPDNELPPTATSSVPGGEIGEIPPPTANLFRLSDTPVAGAVVFKSGTQTIVRYVDRGTGHIYDINLTTLAKTRITNETLPKIYEAYFRPDGNAVLLRSLNDNSDVIENLALTLTPPKATTVSTSSPQATEAFYAISSTLLRGNLSAVAVGSGNTLFYALRDTSSIVSSLFNGTGAKTLLTSPFTNWRLSSAGNSVYVYPKASVNAPGYVYSLNTSSGGLTKILGPLNALSAIPNTAGNRVLYSYVDNGRTRTFAKNLTNNALTEILPNTFSEKCIWSIKQTGILFCAVPIDESRAGEPDNWYRGLTHFSDRLWLFDTNIDVAQVLAEPQLDLNIDIDAVEPKLSPDEDYLVFTNKNDLSLWALKLLEP